MPVPAPAKSIKLFQTRNCMLNNRYYKRLYRTKLSWNRSNKSFACFTILLKVNLIYPCHQSVGLDGYFFFNHQALVIHHFINSSFQIQIRYFRHCIQSRAAAPVRPAWPKATPKFESAGQAQARRGQRVDMARRDQRLDMARGGHICGRGREIFKFL